MNHDFEAQIASHDNRVADILRKAKIIASRRKESDSLVWINYELTGYPNGDLIPDYRRIQGSLHWINPVHGLCPFRIQDREIERDFEKILIGEGVSSLESHLADAGRNKIITYQLGDAALRLIRSWMTPDDRRTITPFLVASSGNIQGVLDAVRNRILDWYIELPKGDAGSSDTYKAPAQERGTVQNINIQNMTGIVGPTSAHSIVITDFSTIQGSLRQTGIADGEQQVLRQLMSDFASAASKKDKESIAKQAGRWVGEHAVELGGLTISILQFFGLGAA